MRRDWEEQAKQTFALRAVSYNSESTWVTNTRLVDPLFWGLSEGSLVADVCSGTGVVAGRATELGFRSIALDASRDMLRHNSVRWRVLCDGAAVPLASNSVRRVVCRQGIHYLDV